MSEQHDSDTDDAGVDRLFVPLNTEAWNAFESGEKTAEFRGVNSQFNTETVQEGRKVELRRGYSTEDSLWGNIGEVETGDDLGYLVSQWYERLRYGGKTMGQVAGSVNRLVGDYETYIVFEVILDE